MGVFHDRTILSRGRAALLALALALASCAGSDEEAAPGTPAPAEPPAAAADAPLDVSPASPVRNGAPMPPAEQAGGIPPYPGAVVYVRLPRSNPEIRSLEAFTPDPYETVVAFYDSALPGWDRVRDPEVVLYDAGGDRAAVTVSVWDHDQVPPAAPAVLKDARTAIGAAWRP